VYEDKEMEPGFSVPEKRARGNCEQERHENDLVSSESMKPGLLFPAKATYAEKTRLALSGALLVYLVAWGGVAVWMTVGLKAESRDTMMLLNVFVAPVWPLVGLAIAFFFNKRGRRRN
jgi:hypothetical protein